LGGTIRNLGKIHRNRIEYPINDLANMDLKSRKKVKGLSSKRADIIVGGLAILKAIISVCSPSRILTSGFGLREGILFDYISKTKFTDALSFSLKSFMEP